MNRFGVLHPRKPILSVWTKLNVGWHLAAMQPGSPEKLLESTYKVISVHSLHFKNGSYRSIMK
jgi:hypothetical protein